MYKQDRETLREVSVRPQKCMKTKQSHSFAPIKIFHLFVI